MLQQLNTGRRPQSLRAWVEHINGAATLIDLRGSEQLRTKLGLQLFYQMRTQIVWLPPPLLEQW